MKFVRLLRTAASERYVLEDDQGTDLGLIDIHFLDDQKVVATLFLMDPQAEAITDVQPILDEIDLELLPTASVDESNLSFTVIRGTLVGTFSSDGSAGGSTRTAWDGFNPADALYDIQIHGFFDCRTPSYPVTHDERRGLTPPLTKISCNRR